MIFNKKNIILLLFSFSCMLMQTRESIYEKRNIAQAYIDEELYEDAIIIYKDILEVQSKIFGPFHEELVQTLYFLSDLNQLYGDLKESETFLRDAMDIQYYNFLINQKKYIPTFEKMKHLYDKKNDSTFISLIDSLSLIVSNIDRDSLFFSNDTSYFFPNIISLSSNLVDSTNLVSEYSLNDKAIDFIDNGLLYLDMGLYSETIKEFDIALKLNSKIVDLDFLLNIDYGDSTILNNFYISLNEVETFDSTITTSQLFSGLVGLKKKINKNTVINHLLDYSVNNHNDIIPYLLIGDIYFQNDNFFDAISFYMRSLLIDKNNIHASLNMAISFMKLNKYYDVIEKLNYLITIDPNNYFSRHYIGVAFYYTKQYENAVNQLTQALLVDSKTDDTYYYLGKSYNALNKKKQALESFQMAIQLNPINGKAHYELGLIYESILKLDEAIMEYNIAKKYFKLDQLNYNLGSLFFKQGQYQNALLPLREYIINHPYNFEVLEMLGEIFMNENRFSEAIDTYNRLLDIHPDNEKYYNNIATSYLILENYEQAKKYYKKVLDFNEENPPILFALGEISNILNEYNSAEKYFLEALYCDYKTKELLFQLGLSYGGQKKFLQALQSFQEALDYSLDDPILHYQLGVVFLELSIYDLAIKEFVQYLNVNNQDAVVHKMIGLSYSYLNQYEDAIKYLLQASKLYNNNDIETYYYLGIASLQLKQEWNAAKYFKQVIKINPDHAATRHQLINVYLSLNKPREANKECDILYMLNRELYYSTQFCNK